MNAVIVKLAEAIKAELNNATFSQPVTAVRGYMPKASQQELADLRVTVVPSGMAKERETRSEAQEDHTIDVAVQKAVADPDDVAAIDSLMLLVQEISDHFFGLVAADPKALCIAIENEPIYSPEHLREMHVFTSVLSMTWRTYR